MNLVVAFTGGSVDGALAVRTESGPVQAASVVHALELLNETKYPFALLRTDRGDRVISVAHIVSVEEYQPARAIPKPPGM